MDNFLITYKAFKNSSLIFVKSDTFHDTCLLFAKGCNEATKPSPGRYIIKSKAVFLICTVLITSPCRTAQRRKMSVNGNVLVHVCTSSHAHTHTYTHSREVDAASWVHTVGRMHLASLNRKERYDRSVCDSRSRFPPFQNGRFFKLHAVRAVMKHCLSLCCAE